MLFEVFRKKGLDDSAKEIKLVNRKQNLIIYAYFIGPTALIAWSR